MCWVEFSCCVHWEKRDSAAASIALIDLSYLTSEMQEVTLTFCWVGLYSFEDDRVDGRNVLNVNDMARGVLHSAAIY